MRYIVEEGSASGHCCFEYTIIDTNTDTSLGECFEKEDADLICRALNYLSAESPRHSAKGEIKNV